MLKTLVWVRRETPHEIGQLATDGLVLFPRKHLSRDEFNLSEELERAVAAMPLAGRPLHRHPETP